MQYNLIYNRAGSLLDLVFSNVHNITVLSATNSLVSLDYNNHPAWDISFPVVSIEYLDNKKQIYHFRHCDYNGIGSLIAAEDWNGIFNNLCITKGVDIFYSNIYKIIDSTCPRICKFSSNYPTWFSSSLKNLIFSKR